ncbi:very-long-chain enoyl-CoA reductase isoform X1 [Girardinichthys multiradiatus]|uniref:very-long-chain enoyl-CoA reductase isoform X1 n=1 Tax=Girardinichthys multiradiatus TaxID=208333 RepID=UPI001FABA89D|nr:very-long-chain enoyl-CoA reductase isoform X1 [Girardinichthys multiradiatus]
MSRTTFFEVEVLDAKTKEQLCFLDKVDPHSTIGDIKSLFYKSHPQWYPARQALRLESKGKSLRDDEILQNLPVGTTATMYFKDLGPQLGWTTVFFAEYIGALLTYLLFFFRVPYIYSHTYAFTSSPHPVVTLACVCHTFHYMKRLMETIFVHRFSHGTMPLRTIIKNCAYYWGFSAWLAYYINHPLYTPPSYGELQIKYALITFAMCEMGNLSIHMSLSNLRVDGFRVRRFPMPTKNPFTWLFFFVSCPNYTYEVGAWMSFTVMTQVLPGRKTLLGIQQLKEWPSGSQKLQSEKFKHNKGANIMSKSVHQAPR